ncbi:S41 family peptidase [Paracidobacterium acidisoli]|uniref:Tail specific protease domain-containing protein n=1 Tax=Paracidobacterium acidisoli TaxID=2303751 RepID=A0A372IRW8_9BACT|nr:S41 family peptidase [Paracidobacterium acidisoli]MBT9330534.1 S41 family peptidase [Paracidobacterium acidisoli]
MSENIYILLLHLYPSQFRRAYGDEAIQLFRDRFRDEQGFAAKVRLWSDLLADLAVSLPREHGYAHPSPTGAHTQQRLAGVPCFDVLESSIPRPEALLFGAVLSVVAVAALSISMSWSAGNGSMRGTALRDTAPAAMKASAFESLDAWSAKKWVGASSAFPGGASSSGQPTGQNAGGQTAVPANSNTTLDAGERQRVIDRAGADLKKYYFDHGVAEKTAEALLTHEKNGDDDAATHGASFAALLTAQMRDASADMHLVVEYSQNPLPSGPPVQTAEGMARFRSAMLQQHCMIRKTEILPHDIGYLKLDFFPDDSVCGNEVREAMASLNHADAIIFDLRDNSGGFPDTVSLVASYLFDHPVYMYGPRGAPTVESWTHSPVAGNNLANKPVYVLTSGTTWSGAEQFSYDLKMLKRATLVGETTRGGTHAGVFHRIDDHFGMGIPEERPINPYGKTDWEGVGVTSDVKVKAADALETAVRLAVAKLQLKQR